MLTDEQWGVIRPLLPAISRQYRNSDPRRFINTVLWLARTNRSWTGFEREYMRYRRWRHVWPALVDELADIDPLFPYSYDPGRGIVFTPPTTTSGAESDSTNDFGL
jgi:transposase